jgi:hypothetical protein
MDRDKLKLIVRNLELLVEALKSEVYSDIDSYRSVAEDRVDMYGGSSTLSSIHDYDEIFDDDDGYPD